MSIQPHHNLYKSLKKANLCGLDRVVKQKDNFAKIYQVLAFQSDFTCPIMILNRQTSAGELVMRIFKKYAPVQIAKHVSAFFKGTFYIQGKGSFRFDGGRVIIDPSQEAEMKRIGREINMSIAAFSRS